LELVFMVVTPKRFFSCCCFSRILIVKSKHRANRLLAFSPKTLVAD
jgi:hypothetical protein